MQIKRTVLAGLIVIGASTVTTITAPASTAATGTGGGATLHIDDCTVDPGYVGIDIISVSTRPYPFPGETYACAYAELHSSIRNIQNRLVRLGYHLTVDGFYGSETARVVSAFQRSHHLTVDGVVGFNTGYALGLKYYGE